MAFLELKNSKCRVKMAPIPIPERNRCRWKQLVCKMGVSVLSNKGVNITSTKKLRKKTMDSLRKESDTNLMMAALKAKLSSEATMKNAPRPIRATLTFSGVFPQIMG